MCDCAAQSEILGGLGGGQCSAVMGRGAASCRQSGGNRAADRALRVTILVCVRRDSQTRAHAECRTQKGLSRMEVIRCLKRCLAQGHPYPVC